MRITKNSTHPEIQKENINITIRKGKKGDDGEGVPTGGSDGDALFKQSSTNYDTDWEAAYTQSEVDSLIANKIDDLDDVSLGTLSSGEVLTYDGSNWVNDDVATATNPDVSEDGTTIITGVDELNLKNSLDVTDAGNSVADIDVDESSIATSNLNNDAGFISDITAEPIGDLTDVTIGTQNAGELLIFDSTNSEFVNSTLTGGTNTTITNSDGSITIDSTDTDTQVETKDSSTSIYTNTASINFGTDLSVTDDGSNAVTVDASSSPTLTVQDDATDVETNTDTLDFQTDFSVTNPTTGEAEVALDSNSLTVAGNSVSLGGSTTVDVEDLRNMDSPSPSAGQLFLYNSTSGNYENASLTAGTNLTNTEGDASVTLDVNDDLSNYDNSTTGFISDITGESIQDLSDVSVTSLASGEALTYDGSSWTNTDIATQTELDNHVSTTDAHHTKYTDEEAQDAVGTIMSGSGATSVTYDDAGNTITVSSTDNDTQIESQDSGTTVYTNTSVVNFDSNLSITDNGSGSITVDAASSTDTTTDVSEAGTTIVSQTDDINFTASNDASINVTDDGDGSASVDVDVTDTDTQVESQDAGTTVYTDTTALNFDANLDVTDEGSGTVRIDASSSTDTRTDISDSGGTVVTQTSDIQFTASNDASVTVTDDGDGTGTVDIDVTDTNTTYTAGTGLSLSSQEFSLNAATSDLNDAASPNATSAGQLLIWNATNGQFENAGLTGGSNVSITENDASITIDATDTDTTYSAGSGLSLSGTTFNADITNETSVTAAGSDELIIADSSDSNNIKKVTAQDIADLSSGDPDQNLWETFSSDNGSTTADTTTDTITISGGSNVSTSISSDTLTIDATDTDTQLSNEEVQDAVYNNVLSGTQTLISVSYDDANNQVDYVVDNDLSNYDNSTSGFISDITGESFGSLSNVNFGTLSAGQLPIYDGTNNEFVNNTLTGGSNVTVTNADGSITIDASDSDTTYSAGTALGLSGTTFNFTQTLSEGGTSTVTGATDINFTQSNDATVTVTDDGDGTATVDVDVTDTDTTYTAGTGLSLSSQEFSLNADTSNLNDAASPNTTAAGQLLIWNSTNSQFENATLTGGSNTTITNGDASITIDSTDTRVETQASGTTQYTDTSIVNFGSDLSVSDNGSGKITVDASTFSGDYTDLTNRSHDNSDHSTNYAEQTYAKGVVVHGSDGTVSRPSGYNTIEWVGSVEPNNANNNDTWVDTS